MPESSWAWRTPTVVQCVLPAIVAMMILFFPETPRFLLANDRREEAIAIMAKYHGDGDANSPIVQLQLQEITEDFARYRDENPWWDLRELFNTKAARYRLFMVICMSFFGQCECTTVSFLCQFADDMTREWKQRCQLLHACHD